jgi:hypothetical protein
MQLKDQVRIGFQSCAVCGAAGKGAFTVYEPVDYEGKDDSGFRHKWLVIISGRDPIPNGNFIIYVCEGHHKLLENEFYGPLQSELNLIAAFDSWIDRIENGKDLYG